MSTQTVSTIVRGLPPRTRVTVYEQDGTTQPIVVDEGLRTEISPAVDADDDGRVTFHVRFPRGTHYVLRWDGGGEATVAALKAKGGK